MKYTESDKVPQYFKFSMETLYLMSILGKVENRSNTSLLEYLVKQKALEDNITVSQNDISEFTKELNDKKNNKK